MGALGMTQKEFADFMGVTQGMVSKWESREYNFTIRSLNEICQKIDLSLSLSLENPCAKNDYTVIKWNEDRFNCKEKKNSWVSHLNIKEGYSMMELNLVATGVEIVGTTVKNLNIENNIVDIEKDGKRSFGLNINEPLFQKTEDELFGQMLIDFELEINQSDEQTCKIDLSIEGAFLSKANVDEQTFKELVIVNGAAALIGIARGKIESISANIFNNGKIVIPFVNVVDYYKSLTD